MGRWTADPARLVLVDDELEVHLRPKVMDLLVVFAEHPGEVLSKERLLDLVWSEVTVSDASLSVAVGELRSTLGDDPRAPEYIETIPRRGYCLIAAVTDPDADPAPLGASTFWLVGAGVELALRQGENLIGRAPESQVRIESPKVSRQHATITVDGDRAILEDLGSKNGTFLGEARITGPTPVASGDTIRLGQLAALLRVLVADRQSTVTELSKELPTGSVADD